MTNTLRFILAAAALALAGCGYDTSCDANCQAESTAQQNAVLGGIIANGGFHSYQSPRPVFSSCTSAGYGASCISQ